MVTDLVKKKVKKVVRKKPIKRMVWKLKEDGTRARYEGGVGELVSTERRMGIRRCVKVRLRQTAPDTRK